MKVRVAVHGRFHAFELARGLHRAHLLECLQTTYPGFAAKRVVGPELPLITVPYLEIRRRLGARLGFSRATDVSVAKGFARALARSLASSDADILVAWSSAALEAISVAHDKGMRVVIERGSTHIAHQTEMLEAAYREHGIAAEITPPEIIERELAEYEAADAIVVPSKIAAASFVDRGIAPGKVFVNHLGVDLSQFSPPREPRETAVPVILCVGALSVRKGTAALFNAFAQIDGRAELVCVGPVEPDFRRVLETLPADNVTLLGAVSRDDVHDAYQSADIFCLPSVEEGFGMVVLEAMASGLPVIVSDQVGAVDLIDDGTDGLIVERGDTDALAAALNSLVAAPEKRSRMGAAASEKAKASQSWDDYIQRAISIYEKVLD